MPLHVLALNLEFYSACLTDKLPQKPPISAQMSALLLHSLFFLPLQTVNYEFTVCLLYSVVYSSQARVILVYLARYFQVLEQCPGWHIIGA